MYSHTFALSSVAVHNFTNLYSGSIHMETQGTRLKKIRCALKLSQMEFGDKINLSRAGIAAVEADKNKFSQDTLYKLSTEYNINLNYLIRGVGEMFINTCENTHVFIKNDKALENFKTWGHRLAKILDENDETSYHFSKRTNIHESRIDDFILDSVPPTIKELNAIKSNVDISIDELLYGENDIKSAQTNDISLSTEEILGIKKLLKNSKF